VRILKTSWFERFADKHNIPDSALKEAITRISEGLIDADLGGGLIKQRIARSGAGKRDGFRAVIICRFADKGKGRDERAFFVYGFAKNDRENLTDAEIREFRKLRPFLDFSDTKLNEMINEKKFTEVKCDGEKI
jgi:hypothetical protein